MDEFELVLIQLIDLGRQIINKGLALRRALDNQTPDQFMGALSAYSNQPPIAVQASGFEFEPPPGEFRGDIDRVEWVKSRLSVIRELATLDYDVTAWLRGSEAVVDKAGGLSKFSTALRGSYSAIKDEVKSLQSWTSKAAQFANAGHVPDVGRGSGIVSAVQGLLDSLGINLNILLPVAAIGAGLFTVLAIFLVVLFLRR